MKQFSCCIKIEFDAAHRIIGHSNKCIYLHGHRYALEVTATSRKLDSLGMVVDFGFLKAKIKDWIDNNFDHTAILSIEDKPLGDSIEAITKQKIYYFPYNTTAENIAFYLKDKILTEIIQSEAFSITSVKVQETPNCYAIVE
jgi:6-pyruvoyltetrahydropterin/6-carboxytetrahydropterin synthase